MTFSGDGLRQGAGLLRQYRQQIAYVLVGGVAAMVYFAAGYAWQRWGGLPPALASFLGFVMAIPLSYAGHKWLTFRAAGRDMGELVRFVVTSVTGLFLSVVLPELLVEIMGLPALVGLGCVSVVVPVVNYILMRLWVFTGAPRS